MKRYFSYDDQNQFELHDTLAEAKAAAEKAFDYCSDEAGAEGWPESVDEICYGELRGHVVETLREPWDVDKHGGAPEEGCEHVEYALHDLPHNAALNGGAENDMDATEGEEIMVNAAHDVYTLPLQPSGLSSGPRFVVHVPGPEAQAMPDWDAAPLGATHYQPHQDAYYKRVSASEWYVWSRKDDRELLQWLLSTGTSDSAEWVVRPTDALAKHQPCGCVICTCEDEKQCQGCGAKHCGNRTDHPPYVKQQPSVHPAITHCDNCGCDWLDNGLNPVGCPYCKQNAWRAAFEALAKDVERCYRMLLSEPDTKGALFKAENILREALAEASAERRAGNRG